MITLVHLGVSINDKWLVYFMENPIAMDDLEVSIATGDPQNGWFIIVYNGKSD